MIPCVLFDIDGVLLSEERCFDASALAVWELLQSPNFLSINSHEFSPSLNEQMIREIRAATFCHDRILSFLKSQGLNSNWDMVFLTFIHQLVHLMSQLDEKMQTDAIKILAGPFNQETLQQLSKYFPETFEADYAVFMQDFDSIPILKSDIYASVHTLFKHKLHLSESPIDDDTLKNIWDLGREVFQEWYVGEDFIEASIGKKARQKGKKGFLQEEIPLASIEELNQIFQWIYDHGMDLGIGTGRPEVETIEPLKTMGLLQWVPREHIVTSNDVLNAEDICPNRGALGKPHPYTYLQSYYGKEMAPEKVLKMELPLAEGDSLLVVGDSVADFYAARSIGARFAAVLTGLTGEKARNEFEILGADYILNNVTELIPLLADLQEE